MKSKAKKAKAAPKAKRPPRQVWIIYSTKNGNALRMLDTKREADEACCTDHGGAVAGPYVLLERKRQK